MYKIEYILLKIVNFFFSVISIKTAEKAAYVLAFFISNIIRYRRKVILGNLHKVYGDELPDKPSTLLKNIYLNFTFLWFEVMQSSKINTNNFNEHFSFHGLEIVEDLLSENKGIILVTGHFGNFEWTKIVFGIKKYPLNAVVKKQHNPYIDAYMNDIRESLGGKAIYMKQALKDGIKLLRKNKILLVVGDQDAKEKGVFVDFLGIPSSTALGTAIFHLRTQSPILFIAMIRKSYAHFDVYFEKVEVPPDLKFSDEAIFQITQAHTKVLDKWIRKYPEQWFWMHKRWKSKPSSAK